MIVHLFLVLTVSIRWRLFFPTLCWSINTVGRGGTRQDGVGINRTYVFLPKNTRIIINMAVFMKSLLVKIAKVKV
jgi:hypothetical protein